MSLEKTDEAAADRTEVKAWHIVSYPRSGNHAVRAILEYLTHRPTVSRGVDQPIHMRKANQDARLIEVHDPDPIGYKAHFLAEILENQMRSVKPSGLILITRDPADAIVSHLYPEYIRWKTKLQKRRLFFAKKRRRVWEDIDWNSRVRQDYNGYLGCVFAYLAWKGRPRLHLKYEDLVNNSRSFCNYLAHQIGACGDLNQEEVDAVLSLSRGSLLRKGGRARDAESVRELKQMVDQFRSYGEICDLLNDEWQPDQQKTA